MTGVPTQPGSLSPDGAYLWDGTRWIAHGPGALSPDRAHIWNGTQWVPNATGHSTVSPQKKGHLLRNSGIGCVGLIGLLVFVGILGNALGGSTSGKNPSASGGGTTLASAGPAATPKTTVPATAPATGCAPKPCASAFSLTVHISGLNRNAPLGMFIQPEAGNHLVLMQMTMHNDGGRDTKNANPFDFRLRDASGLTHDITFSDAPGCDTWSSVDLAPGATLGPKPLCFEAAGDPNGNLSLVWSPSIFSSPQEIHL
jgi:hypothetical protein